ncbi:TrkA C-terminal domain-containing protein [Rubrivirga sp. S365]|uniref:TrkA C-terminal domain-containing protein n=1 Tax=Rubrivirga litoralis TaxID=3075598 RepID=A0ABU3BPE5_9BACT|nr:MULTISPECIES: TrkA C-terminal domain-containing protein [unclassified Rubrivirga]MDT0631168.1 TrkA C-terminal domain-containing protein [Rubrivirga sp. F394]MDT7856689.1 TrkA C-terminal domain-containing protein [Rubrivirga sp. S365]
MGALLTLLLFVTLSVLINQIAAKALMLTGLSEDVARFQARSVSTGTGFTTSEAENITKHPARRRIVMTLMLLHSAGLVTILGTGIASFAEPSGTTVVLRRVVLLVAGVVGLFALFKNRRFSRALDHAIEHVLRRYTTLTVRDYEALLRLREGFRVVQFEIEEGTWLANKTLRELNLPEEGVTVLSILRPDETAAAVPRGSYRLHVGDKVVLYGKEDRVAELRSRPRGRPGEGARVEAQQEHAETERQQDVQQRAYENEKAWTTR